MSTKQRKYRFNVIDVLIILVVIAIGVVMYYYTTARNTVMTNSEVDIEYTIELKTVHKDYVDKILEGNNVVETVRDQQIGKVTAVEKTRAYNIATNTETGEMRIAYYPSIDYETGEVIDSDSSFAEITDELKPEYYNVKVTIVGEFKKGTSGYNINGFDLTVGQNVYFRVPGFVGEGFCIDIKELEK